ncbi:MAG: hypothetical protein KatS3mg070_1205 [Meiothermus sp.]|uniref:COG1470 family protein n=1 Tax=Meiothermus sp. TaxID=1955249 RepID=UPI0021DCBACA|nr:hypothetical protein [Meiothermus sp.]GIW27842.1 MAG: hypothetical protein KatS3mg070_1205 [Meiothermus sp.]
MLATLLLLAGCTRPNPQPSVQITFAPTSLTLKQGETRDVAITLVRTNLTGYVVLELTNPPPAGVKAIFEPNSILGNTTTLRVQASGSATPGNFTLQVRVSQGGFSQTADLPLQVEPASAPDLQLSLDNLTPSIRQGQSADLLLNVVRVNVAGTLELYLEQQNGAPLPDGLSATFSPTLPNSTLSILRISVAPTASITPYPLRIRAKLGSLERTLDFTLTVLEALPEPDFQLNLAQNISLQRGETSSGTIAITRINLSGPIALSLERSDGTPLPTGIRATFAPAETDSTSSTLTISAASDLPLGDYMLRVRGVQGTLERTALVLLNVFDQAELTANGAIWVAAQGDSGAWQVVQPTAGSYRLRIGNTAERYGWAVVCSRTEAGLTTHQVSVYQLTLGEARGLVLQCPPAATSGFFSNLNGQLNGLAGSYGQVAYGTASDFVDPARTGDFPPTPAYSGYLLQGVRQGTADLMALRYLPPSAPGTIFQADRAVFERNYSVGGNQTFNLDTNGPNSFALEGSYTATLTNPNPAAQGLSYLAYLTPTTQTLYLADSQQKAANLTYSAIPAGQRMPNEFYVFNARETTFSNLSLRSRQALRGFANPQNLSTSFLSLPEAHLNLQNNRFQTTWSPYSWSGSGSQLFSLQLEQLAVAPNTNLEWHLHLSQGWLGSTNSYTVPDLAQTCAATQTPCAPSPANAPANGWQAAWGLRSNLELDWSFSAVQVSLPLTDWLPLAQSPLPPTGLNLDGFSFDAASAGGIYNASRLSAQHQVKAKEPRLLPFWLAPR